MIQYNLFIFNKFISSSIFKKNKYMLYIIFNDFFLYYTDTDTDIIILSIVV